MAYAQWIWFTEWFALDEYAYLKKLSTEGALVQERPMAEFEGSGYTEKIHPPWAEGWVWTGDQGMLVAAISDMIAVKDELAGFIAGMSWIRPLMWIHLKEEATAIILTIGKGVKTHESLMWMVSFGRLPVYRALAMHTDAITWPGRGIMMRYLGSEDIKPRLGVNLDQAVLLSTEAIWATRDIESNQFKPEYTSAENDEIFVEQFCKLWGLADNVHTWDLTTMVEKNKNAVCQAVGMDMLGAAIKTLS